LRSYSLAALEDVALWHERDISHSSVERVVLPDATILLDYMVHRLTGVIQGLNVYPARMKANMDKTADIVCSQRVVVALTRKGLQKQEAYEVVQGHALDAWTRGTSFRAALSADPRVTRRLSPKELAACFDLSLFYKNIARVLSRTLR
jgi:adenylosuccinate lyase